MRELMQLNAEEFRTAAVSLLRGETERRGCRYLLTLLWTHDLLLPVLSDARLPVDRALLAAQVAAEIDPQLHIRITRYLIETTLDQQTIDESEATKLLHILSSINDSVSLQPFVRRMLLHPSARVRSKLSLLIGRSQSGNRSLTTLLSDADARVRANAVEALWHNNSPQICSLVKLALDDTNNRVVGNAILGLYFAGDTSAISTAIKLTAHSEPLFRATAAWAMGETRDARFLPCLGRMLAGSVGQLRKAVFHAIGLIKKAGLATTPFLRLQVDVLDVANLPNGKTRVRTVVTAAESGLDVEVRPTGFLIEVAGVNVTDYSCKVQDSDRIHLALAFPRSSGLSEGDCLELEQSVKSCLDKKRAADLWAIARYSVNGAERPNVATFLGQALELGSSNPGAPSESAYTSNLITLKTATEARSNRFEDDPGLLPCLREMIASVPPGVGAKHLVAIIPHPDVIEEHDFTRLVAAAKICGLAIHAVCFGYAPDYLRLCRETEGFYREAEGFQSLQTELAAVCTAVTKLYALDFTHAGAIVQFSVEARAPSGIGKVYWRRPDLRQEIDHLEVA